jgi:hypothetical protein
MRLTRSEANMAYRSAEQARWQQFDFVVGYEIKTTQNGRHVEDICDTLAGKYPKDFQWTGWHPQCMCYRIPILKTEEEFWATNSEDSTSSINEVKDVPERFKDWITKTALMPLKNAVQRLISSRIIKDTSMKHYRR